MSIGLKFMWKLEKISDHRATEKKKFVVKSTEYARTQTQTYDQKLIVHINW